MQHYSAALCWARVITTLCWSCLSSHDTDLDLLVGRLTSFPICSSHNLLPYEMLSPSFAPDVGSNTQCDVIHPITSRDLFYLFLWGLGGGTVGPLFSLWRCHWQSCDFDFVCKGTTCLLLLLSPRLTPYFVMLSFTFSQVKSATQHSFALSGIPDTASHVEVEADEGGGGAERV